jgi:hypothetical protein
MPDGARVAEIPGVTIIESSDLGVRPDGAEGAVWSGLLEYSPRPWVSSLSVGDLGEVRLELWPLWSSAPVDRTSEHRSVFSDIYRRFDWVVTVTYPDEVEVFAAKDRKAADSLFNVLVSSVS